MLCDDMTLKVSRVGKTLLTVLTAFSLSLTFAVSIEALCGEEGFAALSVGTHVLVILIAATRHLAGTA